ncbi:MAG: DUF3140 domain-containing protein [Janthinobacterium lividum]
MADENADVTKKFGDAVNMTASEITRWLETDNSKAVGQKQDGKGESTGHQSGRSIAELLHKKHGDYSEDDISQMKRVISYVHRHLAEKPSGDTTDTHWRYSLMNWGHDPSKK